MLFTIFPYAFKLIDISFIINIERVDIMNIGESLKYFRKRNNFTQVELSKLLNVKQSTYCGYEKNTSEPDLEILFKLADLYIISLDLLCGRMKISENNKAS